MPVRARSLPESVRMNGNNTSEYGSNFISPVRTTPSDRSYDWFSIGRRPAKQKKHNGLNGRMAQMLHRANTSYTEGLLSSGAKRPRVSSNDASSSSVVSFEAPRTPVDAIHNAVNGNSLGSEFSVIKANSSSDFQGMISFPKNKLPSWRDGANCPDPSTQKPRELPGWLFHTFSTLEPGYPLRDFVSDYEPEQAHGQLQGFNPYDNTLQNDTQAENVDAGVFAFAPPVAGSQEGEEDATTTEYEGEYFVPGDNLGYDVVQDVAQEIRPFAQPGPFVNKSVHFLTPSRSSPLPVSNLNHTKAHYRLPSPLATRTDDHLTNLNPFVTPGPASRFSVFTLNPNRHTSIKDTTENDDILFALCDTSSDSLTLADNTRSANDDPTKMFDPNFTTHDTDLNLNLEYQRPFSTPGPIFCAPPTVYFNSPTEDPSITDYADSPFDDIELESENKLTNVSRFVSRHHTEIANKIEGGSGMAYDDVNLTNEDFTLDALDNLQDILRRDETLVMRTPVRKVPTPVHAIKLSSSSPYVRIAFADDSGTAPEPAPDWPLSTQHNIFATPNMGFRNVPDSGTEVPAEPCTPPPKLPPAKEADRKLKELNAEPLGLAKNALVSTSLETKKTTATTISKPAKFRPAFAPAPGIYLSPLSSEDDGELLPVRDVWEGVCANEPLGGDATAPKSKANTTNTETYDDTDVWKMFEGSDDDSIEDWEA